MSDQALVALERANRIRIARAHLRRRISVPGTAGRDSAVDALLDPPEEAATMPVLELVRALHRVQRTRALRILRRAGVGEHRPVGQLTHREAHALVNELLTLRVESQRAA